MISSIYSGRTIVKILMFQKLQKLKVFFNTDIKIILKIITFRNCFKSNKECKQIGVLGFCLFHHNQSLMKFNKSTMSVGHRKVRI